jgi:plasmid stabilization system protein ParE
MAERIVILHPLAAREYLAAIRWYARRSTRAAERFREAIDRVIHQIETAAEQGTVFRSPFYWMRARRFPYVLYYEISDPGPTWVYAVAHVRRRAGYWLRRARP